MQIDIIFGIAVLVMSVVIHEVSHGYMANFLGDPTARLAGRLTLNPFKHLDMFGSILLPATLILTHSPVLFGWAKPVPYNPYNLRRGGLWAEALVALAGPASNLFLAVALSVFLRVAMAADILLPGVVTLALSIVYLNVMLALFNLIPIPPLDGSKILSAILPPSLAQGWEQVRARLEYNSLLGFGIVILFVLFLSGGLSSLVQVITRVLVGV